MNLYIGLDAHSATSTAVVVDERGEIKHRATFPTSEANLTGFVRRLPQSATLHLTLEECHLAQWLYLTLVEHVDELIVCNPVYLAKKPGAKTDFRDALHLAQELRTGHLKPVHHEPSEGPVVDPLFSRKGIRHDEVFVLVDDRFFQSLRDLDRGSRTFFRVRFSWPNGPTLQLPTPTGCV